VGSRWSWKAVIQARKLRQPRMVTGYGCGFLGALPGNLLDSLRARKAFPIHFFNRVQDLHRNGDLWTVRVRDEKSGEHWDVQAKFFSSALRRIVATVAKIPDSEDGLRRVSGEWSFGFAATIPGFLPATMPRCTVKPRWVHLRCPYPISIRGRSKKGFSAVRAVCRLFDEVSQSHDHILISSAPSIRKIYCRCWRSAG